MERIKPRTLSGFMELLPAPQTQFERMLEKLRATYSLYGFTPLDTPIIESAEILLAKGGGETEKQIYRFTKGDSDLDPDLKYINQMCDQYNIPFATNAATAEILIHGLERGDLDWREIINPSLKPVTV